MIAWLKHCYAGYLIERLVKVNRKLWWLTECRDTTEFNDWTEGYLGYLDRRIADLIAARNSLKRRLYLWTQS